MYGKINIKHYCRGVRIAWIPQFLKIRWETPWLNFEVDLSETGGGLKGIVKY